MKIEKAKDIIGTMNLWQMFLMGIVEKPEYELDKKLTLKEIIEANEICVQWNKNQRKKGGSVSQQITMAYRLIAAVYVAMNYEPDSDVKAIMGNVGVGCVKMNYSK